MSDTVARLNAALEGRYAIERELGEGGMATVYLADDLKHERKDKAPGAPTESGSSSEPWRWPRTRALEISWLCAPERTAW